VIAGDVGYGTLAHFKRQFLLLKGMTPLKRYIFDSCSRIFQDDLRNIF
jgi:hypothetical protein